MSMLQVLATILAAMQDATTGMAAQVSALSAEPGVPAIRNEWTFGKWGIPATALTDARASHIIVRPSSGRDEATFPQRSLRDGQQRVEVSIGVYAADPAVIQDTLAVAQLAALRVIERLPEFSSTQEPEGTIYEVAPGDSPVETDYEIVTATYGVVTLRFDVLERSNF